MVPPMSKSFAAFTVVAALVACGSKDPKPAAPPPAAVDAAAVVVDAAAVAVDAAPAPEPAAAVDAGGGGAAWDDLSKEEQTAVMRNKVMPAMKTAFKGFDAKDFAKFNCKTCHGAGAVDKTFEMPNPKLPRLDFAALKAGKDAAMVKFMKETVTPQVAELLGMPVHDATHPDGFGCLDCHLEKGK